MLLVDPMALSPKVTKFVASSELLPVLAGVVPKPRLSVEPLGLEELIPPPLETKATVDVPSLRKV